MQHTARLGSVLMGWARVPVLGQHPFNRTSSYLTTSRCIHPNPTAHDEPHLERFASRPTVELRRRCLVRGGFRGFSRFESTCGRKGEWGVAGCAGIDLAARRTCEQHMLASDCEAQWPQTARHTVRWVRWEDGDGNKASQWLGATVSSATISACRRGVIQPRGALGINLSSSFVWRTRRDERRA